MKKYLLILFSLSWVGCFSQSIVVDTNTYTIPQLVTDVLVNKTCVPISNISWRTGTNFGSSNGIGYFKNTNPSFPLSSGVILSTGDVANAPGPNTSELNDGNAAWTGDASLEATLLASGINMKSTNATVLEFDFVPFSSNFDFQFLFASEEYGNFQCQFSDAFSFVLTNTATGVTTNLAVVPGTSAPISVTTIRNFLYNSSCPSANANYFGTFNGGSEAATSTTNFNGQTVVMSASSSSLIPYTTYHIKLVIADRKDSRSDSAIFLGADSFNIGQDVLGPDLTIANNTAICDKGTQTLFSGLNPAIYSFAWTYNGNPIGGNTPNLTVNQPGVYGLTYDIIATSCSVTTDFITVEYYPQIKTPDPITLFKCDAGLASYTYDLSINTPIISIPGTQVSYYDSLSNASLNTNQLPDSYSLASTSLPATIWVRIVDTDSKCFSFVIKSFLLRTTPNPVSNKPGDITLCEIIPGSNKATFDIRSQTTTIMGGQSRLIYDLSYYASAADANSRTNVIDPKVPVSRGNTTLFARVQTTNDPTCFTTTDFKLIVVPRPLVDQPKNEFVCVSYTLPPLINPGSYYSGPNREEPMLNVGDVIDTDKTIYIYSATSGTPSCANENRFNVKIITGLDLNPIDIITCDQYTLPSTIFGLRYFSLPGGPGGGGIEFLARKAINTAGTTTVYAYFESTDIANPCILEGQFNITIYKTPTILPIANVFECSSYNLPPLPVGDYYTYDTSTGIYTQAISPITSTTTLYVYAINNICRTPDTIFTVYIGTFGFTDINACISYNLPPAYVGEFRDAPNGGGNLLLPGIITTTTNVFTYIPGAACLTDSFTIKINAPFLSTPPEVSACESFVLPTQADGGDYYLLPGGPTTVGNVQLIPNIDIITTTKTIYIYKPSTTLEGCYNEKSWNITINKKPKIDSRANVDQCNFYVLTQLQNGAYFDDPNGVNPLKAGTVITQNNRVYIFRTSPTDPTCFSENFFDISITGVEADPIPTQLSYCDSFTFPELPTPNNFYYDAPGGPFGGGKIISPGTTVTASTALPTYYIYYETSKRLNCNDENSFSIKVTPRPVANPVSPIETCDTFAANDGIFQFDLISLSIRNQVLRGQTPDADFTLTFYPSLAEANDIKAISIKNPSTYQNDTPFSDSIWIRVANNTSAVACFDVVELKLIVNCLPKATLLSEYFICEDYATGTLLNPVILNSGISGAGYLFEWTLDGTRFGGNTSSITTTQAGNYVLKATNVVTQCFKTVATKVIKNTPYLELTYSDAFDFPTFITVNVLGSTSATYEYQLDDFPYQDSNVFNNVLPGERLINVRDKNGNCDPAPMKVMIVNFPKFFTPNGDGYNDTWNISHLVLTNPNAQIQIFDRYGKILTVISPTSAGWNGTLNGQPLPSSDYWFTLNFDEKGESKIFKSHFSLKR